MSGAGCAEAGACTSSDKMNAAIMSAIVALLGAARKLAGSRLAVRGSRFEAQSIVR
jgi:hypothetical protein